MLSGFLGQDSSKMEVSISLRIIKEMLVFTKKGFKGLLFLIQWLFAKSEQKMDAKSSYYIISESLGKLAFLDQEAARYIIS